LTLVDTYVDLSVASNWTPEQRSHHAIFMESLSEAGKSNLLESGSEACPACGGAMNACPADGVPVYKPLAAPAAPPKAAQPSGAGAVRAAPASQPAAQAPKNVFDFGDN